MSSPASAASIRASSGSTRSPSLSAGSRSKAGAATQGRRRCHASQEKTPAPGFKACSPATSTLRRDRRRPPLQLQAELLRRRLGPRSEASREDEPDAHARGGAERSERPLSAKVERGELPGTGSIRLAEARVRFVAAAREGRVLNKQGRRYKPRAIDAIDEVLRVHVEPTLGAKRISTIRLSHIQSLVGDLTPTLSGSRVRSIVNGLRSLYRWAQYRELTSHDPAALVRLPAMDATPIERVASPAEFVLLLAALDPEDAPPYALAGYAMGRRAQIVRLTWPEPGPHPLEGRPQSRCGRMGRRVGATEVRCLTASGADRPAVDRAPQACPPGAGPSEGRARVPTAYRMGNDGSAQHGLAR